MSDLNDFFSEDQDDIWSKPDMSEWSNEDKEEENNGSDVDLFSNEDNTETENNDSDVDLFSNEDNTETEKSSDVDLFSNQDNTETEKSSDVDLFSNEDNTDNDEASEWSDNTDNDESSEWSESTDNAEASTSDADDSWMTNNEQDDGWSEVEDGWNEVDNDQSNENSAHDWGNDEINTEQEQKEIKIKNFSFNYKQASLIIAGICVFLALIIFGMSKIHFVNNSTQQQNVSKEASNVESNATGSKTLKYVPNTTTMNYGSDVITSSGKVVKKDKYLLGQQLIYDLVIEIPAGTETLSLHYYCSQDVFDKMYENTAVTVDYQVASDNYYSIKSVKTQ